MQLAETAQNIVALIKYNTTAAAAAAAVKIVLSHRARKAELNEIGIAILNTFSLWRKLACRKL